MRVAADAAGKFVAGTPGYIAPDQVLDPIDALPAAADRQQRRAQQRLSATLRHARPDHHVDHALLVLERDEDRAAGGLRFLALGDDARDRHMAAVPTRRHFP